MILKQPGRSETAFLEVMKYPLARAGLRARKGSWFTVITSFQSC
jgi:hypothetical protein